MLAILFLLTHPGAGIAEAADGSNRVSLDTGTGLLQRGAGYASAAQAARVRVVQRRLHALGWRPGPVDGLFGSRTEGAVVGFQREAGVPSDGIVGPLTRRALDRARTRPLRHGDGYAEPVGSPRVRKLQRALRRRGMHPGPVDGLFGPRTERAVERSQRTAGLPVSGVASARTRRALAHPASPAPATPRRVQNRTPQFGFPGAAEAPQTARSSMVEPEMLVLVAALALLLGALLGMVAFGRVSTVAGMARPRRSEVDGHPGNGQPELVKVVGYVSVPDSGDDVAGPLREQAREIGSLCEQRGWQLVDVVHDVGTNGRAVQRPGLMNALERVARGEASCLVVSQVGRLARSVADLGRVLEWLAGAGGRLVAMDVGLDTVTADGRIAARTLVSVGASERLLRAERTRKGLEAARAKGMARGRPTVQDVPALKERIVEMRAAGMTLQDIADELNDSGVPTLRGGAKWRPSSVQTAAGYRRPKRSRMPGRSEEGSRD